MKVYYFIGRLMRPFAVFAFRIYSYIFHTPRVRVVLKRDNGDILLVQSWLNGDLWGLPGGGVDRGEDLVDAALRELQEEVGIDELKAGDLKLLFSLKISSHVETVFLVGANDIKLPKDLPHKFEVKDASWFLSDDLPNLEPIAREIIDKIAE